MSRSATPATRNEATRRLKPPKRTTSAKLPIGTAIRSSYGRLRTVADGCARERNVERTHPQPPDPQSETGTLATHSGKRHCGINLGGPKRLTQANTRLRSYNAAQSTLFYSKEQQRVPNQSSVNCRIRYQGYIRPSTLSISHRLFSLLITIFMALLKRLGWLVPR